MKPETEESIIELYDKFQEIAAKGWIKASYNRYASVGNTFEKLLGIKMNALETPDYKDIEIKCKNKEGKRENVTLFSANPDSRPFEIQRLRNTYGYPDKTLPNFKVFSIDVRASRKEFLSRKYSFLLKVDRKKKRLTLNVYDNYGYLIDSRSSWSFDLLKEKLHKKLKYLAFVNAERKYIDSQLYFKYTNIDFYKLTDFDKFIELIENGNIRVSFRIGIYKYGEKLGDIYNRGTAFDLKLSALDKLFLKIDTPL